MRVFVLKSCTNVIFMYAPGSELIYCVSHARTGLQIFGRVQVSLKAQKY